MTSFLPQNLKGLSDIERVPSFQLEGRHKTLHIINLMGNFAMKDEYGDPLNFKNEKIILSKRSNQELIFVVADIHAEASSEKQAIAWFYDGILLASLIGTHTHTPTSDERLTEKGTAFLTDVGMTGPYDSVIGMDKHRVLTKFTTPHIKLPP